jgi:hypothetical protein
MPHWGGLSEERIVVPRRVLVSCSVVVASVLVGGVIGAVVGVPALSGASEGTTSTTLPKRDHVRAGGEIDAAAAALGLTSQQLLDKLSDGKTTIADVAAQQHVDINTVIDAMAKADRDRIEKIVNSPWPMFGPHMKAGAGALGPKMGFAPRLGFGLGGPMALDAAAKALGISTSDLVNELHNGKTIAQVAKDKNVDVNNVINAMVTQVDNRIDQAQKNGHFSASQAADAKAKVKAAITNVVNNGLRMMPKFGHFGRPGAMPFPPMGPTA